MYSVMLLSAKNLTQIITAVILDTVLVLNNSNCCYNFQYLSNNLVVLELTQLRLNA